MPRPKEASGKTSVFREDLNSWRRNDAPRFVQEIARIKQLYILRGSVELVAKDLDIGKRTFDRAMNDIPELQSAIKEARQSMGR